MRRAPYLILGAFGALLLVLLVAVLRQGVATHQAPRLPWERPLVERDLEAILPDTLRLLVLRDPLSWEEHPRGPTGLEYELLLRFAASLPVPVRAIPMDHPDSMLLALQRGVGDVIAAQASPRRDQRSWVAWSEPYATVRPVVARLREDPQVPRPPPAAGDSLPADTAWSHWSPFAGPRQRWDPALKAAPPLHPLPTATPEDLLVEVLLGRAGAALISDAQARQEAGRFPPLEFSAPVGAARQLCFVLRRNAPRLRRRLDAWLQDPAQQQAVAALQERYGKALPKPGPLRTRKVVPITGDSISPFDAAFQHHGTQLPWGWELLAAMAYKESRFDSTVASHKGAQGIMQIMPRTAERLGLGPDDAMADHIGAAVRYLNKLDTLWRRMVPDREQRLRFVLASYNAGPGHIIDAQRLAEQLGLDPQRWEQNVERAVLLKAKPRFYQRPGLRNGYCNGRQVFHYVREVLGLYRQVKARPKVTESVEVGG